MKTVNTDSGLSHKEKSRLEQIERHISRARRSEKLWGSHGLEKMSQVTRVIRKLKQRGHALWNKRRRAMEDARFQTAYERDTAINLYGGRR